MEPTYRAYRAAMIERWKAALKVVFGGAPKGGD
jgi:hypothetical protein